MDDTATRTATPMLTRIAEVFGLSHTELGRLFGVSRQAVSQWLDDEIPAARLPKTLAITQIADALAMNLIPDRIPAVARTPAAAYDGRTMLQMIQADRHTQLLASVRASMDWGSSA